jgi:UDP-N-acetylmuramyl pentapeptide phosphotransferase/UDP-N-acetylglucosamine-1-phosphate transferase
VSALFWAPLLTFLLTLGLVRALSGERLAALVLDIPNDRSLHDRPIPRTGGVGIMLVVGAVLQLLGAGPLHIVIPALLLALLFVVDDVRGLPVSARFAAQFIAAIAFALTSGAHPVLLSILVLGIVWGANLYNFMDGSNGLAGGMAVIGFGAYALAAHFGDAADLALLAAVVAGAAAGFLVWNFDPARIFLGDAGSIPLGFLAGAIGVAGWQRGTWPFWLPLLVFSPFVMDATVTLFQRIVRGEKPWQAHRTHYYQRMIRSGWSHRRLALAAYAVMLAAAASAVTHRTAEVPAVAMHLVLWAVAYAVIAVAIDRRWQAHEGAAKQAGPSAAAPAAQAGEPR